MSGTFQPPENVVKRMAQIKHSIAVLSGKGGVGKSTTSVHLARGLAHLGKRVALLDADLHGPNLGKMLGVEGNRMEGDEGNWQPVPAGDNLVVAGMGVLGGHPDQPIIWRGPMKMKALEQLLGETAWGERDYLIIDLPPGTGDEALSVCQLLPRLSGAIIVTTPQQVAVLDARKSVRFAQQLKVPVIGIIENMRDAVCPHCGTLLPLFGSGGGETAARELGVPFLGAVPLVPAQVALGDSGTGEIPAAAQAAWQAILSKVITAAENTEE